MAEATRSGRWVHRDADIHRCGRPSYQESPGVKVGDVWECNQCHTRWKVTGFDSGMQWDPYPTQIKWQRVEENPIYGGGIVPR